MSTFLDNRSDIVLDAVLTDYGRQLLARGDGSFNIVKFALGDDEIDYSLFDTAAATGQKDAKILATPILEAFTNNYASMKSKLLTIANKNLLYLPILSLEAASSPHKTNNFFANAFVGGFVVPVDTSTTTITTANYLTSSLLASSLPGTDGILNAFGNYIRIDQGLNSLDTDKTVSLKNAMPDLYESEYNIYIDNRFGFITDVNGNRIGTPSVDDDQVALWKVSEDGNFVSMLPPYTGTAVTDATTIDGTPGSSLKFGIAPQLQLGSGNYFTKYGQTVTDWGNVGGDFSYITTVVKVVGVTTGYSIDIPVAFAKKV
jgi:hypothetical protein